MSDLNSHRSHYNLRAAMRLNARAREMHAPANILFHPALIACAVRRPGIPPLAPQAHLPVVWALVTTGDSSRERGQIGRPAASLCGGKSGSGVRITRASAPHGTDLPGRCRALLPSFFAAGRSLEGGAVGEGGLVCSSANLVRPGWSLGMTGSRIPFTQSHELSNARGTHTNHPFTPQS